MEEHFVSDEEAMGLILADILELEVEFGREFTDEERQALIFRTLREEDEAGIIDVRSQVEDYLHDEHEWSHRFDSDVTSLENKLGRRVTAGERDELFDAAPDDDPQLVETFEAMHKGEDPFDGSTKTGRVKHGKSIADEVYEDAGITDKPNMSPPETYDHNDTGERRAAAQAIAERAYSAAEQGEAA